MRQIRKLLCILLVLCALLICPAMAEETTDKTKEILAKYEKLIEEKAAEVQETPALVELKNIEVPRDAERLPKEYVAAITKIIESDKRDPHKLLDDLDQARWDMLKKAYGRNLGDGLNGSGGNGSIN